MLVACIIAACVPRLWDGFWQVCLPTCYAREVAAHAAHVCAFGVQVQTYIVHCVTVAAAEQESFLNR
jgi:hypothetical protein